MKAVEHLTYGGPDVLKVAEVAAPAPGRKEIVVSVEVSPVTRGDRRFRAADFPAIFWLIGRAMTGLIRPKHRVPGTIFAGSVVALGEGASRFAVGDRVFGFSGHGAHAEQVAIDENGPVARIPETVDAETAAILPYGAATARMFWRKIGRLQPGQKVLVLGATGGVGAYAVQVAKAMGAEVTGVASGNKLGVVREMGADHTIDYRSQDWTATGPYDLIFDTAHSTSFKQAKRALAPKGRLMFLETDHREIGQVLRTMFNRGRKAVFGVAIPNAAELAEVAEMAARGEIRALIAARYPLTRIAEAHARLETGGEPGAVLVVPQPMKALKAA